LDRLPKMRLAPALNLGERTLQIIFHYLHNGSRFFPGFVSADPGGPRSIILQFEIAWPVAAVDVLRCLKGEGRPITFALAK
jgi:hypothetical protein